jgi:hypothetical protein
MRQLRTKKEMMRCRSSAASQHFRLAGKLAQTGSLDGQGALRDLNFRIADYPDGAVVGRRKRVYRE